MCCIILSPVASLAVPYFSTLAHKISIFGKGIELVISVLKFCLKSFSFKDEFSDIMSQMCVGVRIKYPLFLSEFSRTFFFHDRFAKIHEISNFMKIGPVGAYLFHMDRRTDRYNDGNSLFSQFL